MARPLALITNDDGIASPGLVVLARAARAAGYEPLVAAPTWDSSGASASLTAVERDGRVVAEAASLAAEPGNGNDAIDAIGATVIAVEAAPAFIVRAAIGGAFGRPPDVVLSGVNRGPNLGHVVLHSGTVGAALTAAASGRSALAASLDVGDRWHWDTADEVVATVVGWLDRLPPGIAVNLNVPAVEPDDLRGIAAATLAPFGAVQSTVTEAGAGWLRVEYEASAADRQPGTDATLLADGFATVTVLQGIEAGPTSAFDHLLPRHRAPEAAPPAPDATEAPDATDRPEPQPVG